MGFFSKITRPFKKAANKIIKPFQKVSDKLIPNELRPLLPYASMFIPGSGILSGLGGAGRFASMYGTNMLTQAMADPEADFEDLNQLSGILSGGQGYLSGASAAGDLRNMQSPEMQSYKQALNLNETGGQMIKPTAMTGLNNRSILSKVGDLGLEGLAKGSEYLTGNNKILQDVGSGRVDLFDIENAKAAAKAIEPKAPTKRAIVLAFVKGRSFHGATNNEIAECNGMKLQTVCPRVNELTKKYLLRDSGRTRDGSTVWIAV